MSRTIIHGVVLLAGLAPLACVEQDLSLPTADDVAAIYDYSGGFEAEMSGNVAVLTVTQPAQQLRRGGTIWAKVGPYILLFTEETQGLFMQYGGLAGVRVVTQTPGGVEVAKAFLARDGLNELTWKRALNIAGHARRDGTTRITLLEDLIDWGEEHTEFEYNPRYVSRR